LPSESCSTRSPARSLRPRRSIQRSAARSLSPALQEEEARHHGLRLHYQLIDLDIAGTGVETLPELIRAVRLIGFAGLNVTYPCKQSVIEHLSRLSEDAKMLGAVNTVVFHDGERMDAAAVKFNLERHKNMKGSNRRGELAVMSSVDAVDPSTVRINLAAPFAPLLAVLADGLSAGAGVLAQAGFWRAATASLVIGSLSALLCVTLALTLGMGRAARGQRLLRPGLSLPVFAYLAVPAVVLSLGFFLLVRALGVAPANAAPYVVVIANALLSLPFAAATLGPPLEAIAHARGKLIRSLGLSGLRQFLAVEYPLIGRDIGIALALAFCFSLGDLGVIALFGMQDFQTLPLMMYRALGSYRSNDAAAIAAILLVLTIVAFVGLPRLIERLSNARA
jgi:ABC-type spermidine/putrescine transport system permease subunit II